MNCQPGRQAPELRHDAAVVTGHESEHAPHGDATPAGPTVPSLALDEPSQVSGAKELSDMTVHRPESAVPNRGEQPRGDYLSARFRVLGPAPIQVRVAGILPATP